MVPQKAGDATRGSRDVQPARAHPASQPGLPRVHAVLWLSITKGTYAWLKSYRKPETNDRLKEALRIRGGNDAFREFA
jgi:hypothetical protein